MKKNEPNVKTSLEDEITSLKRQLAGSKGRNKQLTQDVEKWKAYGKEADELIDKKVSVIDELNRNIDTLNSTIDALNAEIGEHNVNYKELEGSYAIACSKIKDLQLDLEMAKRPWWKKIF